MLKTRVNERRGSVAKVWLAVVLGAGVSCTRVWAQQGTEVSVAAAADLQPVMPALAAAYEKQTGVKLKVSFASSSVLTQQIVNGAPFDVFLAADYSFPEKIVAAKLAVENEPVPYARGTLVLFARKDFPMQLTIDVLTDARVKKIAVADQFKAPYGAAAYATMRQMKTLEALKAEAGGGREHRTGSAIRFVGKCRGGIHFADFGEFAADEGDRQLRAGATGVSEDPAMRSRDQGVGACGGGTGFPDLDDFA